MVSNNVTISLLLNSVKHFSLSQHLGTNNFDLRIHCIKFFYMRQIKGKDEQQIGHACYVFEFHVKNLKFLLIQFKHQWQRKTFSNIDTWWWRALEKAFIGLAFELIALNIFYWSWIKIKTFAKNLYEITNLDPNDTTCHHKLSRHCTKALTYQCVMLNKSWNSK